jgi:hypothetical protein
MPGYDQTGPAGSGPMSGGAFGPCNPASTEDAGRGRGRIGRGQMRGFRGGAGRRAFAGSVNNEATITSLKQKRDMLNQRIEEMEKDANAQ